MLEEVLTGAATFRSLQPCDLSNCSKREIRDYFLNSYALNESLFLGLKDESAMYVRPERLRLPLIFYYGHTACVYMNKLVLAGLLQPSDRVNKHLETLLETGVDEMSWDDTDNYRMGGKFQWPPLAEVLAYRHHVKKLILKLIDDLPLELPITQASPWWALFMGMEHERIHVETSSVLIRQLPVHLVTTPPGWNYAPSKHDGGAMKNAMIEVEQTEVTLGKPRDFPSYGWDNEYGHTTIRVPRFEASKYLVTNSEFLGFVNDGGYEKREYWSEAGWQWKEYREAKHPTFWMCTRGCKSSCGGEIANCTHCKPTNHIMNGQNGYCNGHSQTDDNGHQGKDEGGGDIYRYRGMYSELRMPWDWPVDVNYHEAKAFCCWKGPHYRLLTEAEHNVIRGDTPVSNSTSCDIIYHDDIPANVNMKYGSSTPVNMFPPTAGGFYDVYGNVWEWVEDHFNGLPGGGTHYLYDDFSSPGYDGRHTMILGGAWVSTGDEASRFARFAFRRHFFQHSGFRVARSLPEPDVDRIHLPARLINTELYMLGHGPQPNPEPPMDPTEYTFEYVPSTNTQLSGDTESAVNAMMVSEYGSEPRFAEVCVEKCMSVIQERLLQPNKALHVGCATGRATSLLSKVFQQVVGVDSSARFIDTCQDLQRGQLVPFTENEVQQSAQFDNDIMVERLVFKQLTWLPQEIECSDFILVNNLDRVVNPKAWLARMKELVLHDGLLAVVGTEVWGPAELEALLGDRFRQVCQHDVPLIHQSKKKRNVDITYWIPK